MYNHEKEIWFRKLLGTCSFFAISDYYPLVFFLFFVRVSWKSVTYDCTSLTMYTFCTEWNSLEWDYACSFDLRPAILFGHLGFICSWSGTQCLDSSAHRIIWLEIADSCIFRFLTWCVSGNTCVLWQQESKWWFSGLELAFGLWLTRSAYRKQLCSGVTRRRLPPPTHGYVINGFAMCRSFDVLRASASPGFHARRPTPATSKRDDSQSSPLLSFVKGCCPRGLSWP